MIFIFGAPRSGTSWLGKILDSHPNTLYRAEPDKELRNTDIPFLCTEQDIVAHREATARYAEVLMNVHNSNALGSPPYLRKAYHSDVQFALRQTTIYAVKSLGRIKGLSGPLGNLNVPDFADYSSNATIEPVIKSVGSLGRVGLYLSALPDAKIIVIVRHPCGHIASVVSGQKLRKLPQSMALGGIGETEPAQRRGMDQQTLESLPIVEQLAWRWLVLNEMAMQQAAGNDNVMILKYEDLCAEPEKVTREIFAFSGLDWSPQTEDFVSESTASRNKNGTGYFSINRDPLVAAMKWKEQMAQEDIASIRGVVTESLPGKLFADSYS